MDAFGLQGLATDLIEVKRIFTEFFAARSPADWQRRTERHDKGWTLRETIAHLDSVGQIYLRAVEATLAGQACPIPGLLQRTDLPTWNQREIEARMHWPVTDLCSSFLDTLQQATDFLDRLSPTVLTQQTLFPFYNRPITVGELLAGLAAHPGLVHAAQVANGAGVAPLWVHYAPAMLQRQITRFFHFMSLSYWPERGGDLRATVNFNAAGPGGGSWYVTMTPTGSEVGTGSARRATLTVWFRNADALCRAFTQQVSPLGALLTARAFAWGNLPLGFRLPWLFNPA